MIDQDEYVELMIRAGRVPYKCNFDGTDYDEKDSDKPDGPRVRVQKKEDGNAWSSKSRLGGDDGYHLPVFDVDHDPERVLTVLTVRDVVALQFPEAPLRWVPSTTPGHYHVYMDYPILFSDYMIRLYYLTTLDIVEHGYGRASRKRGATFVRMEHVKKETQPNDQRAAVPSSSH
jgi:hypothetical protein